MTPEEHRQAALSALLHYPPEPLPEMEICRLLEGVIHAVLAVAATEPDGAQLPAATS